MYLDAYDCLEHVGRRVVVRLHATLHAHALAVQVRELGAVLDTYTISGAGVWVSWVL